MGGLASLALTDAQLRMLCVVVRSVVEQACGSGHAGGRFASCKVQVQRTGAQSRTAAMYLVQVVQGTEMYFEFVEVPHAYEPVH